MNKTRKPTDLPYDKWRDAGGQHPSYPTFESELERLNKMIASLKYLVANPLYPQCDIKLISTVLQREITRRAYLQKCGLEAYLDLLYGEKNGEKNGYKTF